MSEVRPIVRIHVADVPLIGASATVSFLARDIPEGTAGRFEEGWDLRPVGNGVAAVKGERSVVIPWPQVRLVEYGPPIVEGSKK